MRSSFIFVGVAGVLLSALGACSSHSDLDGFVVSSAPTSQTPKASASPNSVGAADPPTATANQPGGCNVVRVGSQTATPGTSEQGFAAAADVTQKRIIFLNRNGGTYYPGNGYDNSSANQSSLLSQAVTLPAYSRTDADWQSLLALSQQTYAPFNVVVTDVDPGATAHVEVVVSGSPSMIGQPSTAAGVSPLTADCSVIERAVVFAFDQLLQGPDDQARVVTHEAGHAFGLDHEFYCPDLMSYLFDCAWPKHFEDATVACGEYQARACNCGGEQDSAQHLFSALGQNDGSTSSDSDAGAGTTSDAGSTSGSDGGATTTPSPLSIALTSPDDGATLTANAAITLTAQITGGTASKVLLEWQMPSGNVEVDCDNLPANTTCNKSGGAVTFSFIAGTGSRSWSVHTVDASGATAVSTTRSLTLAAATTTLPSVAVTSPSAGGTFNPGDIVNLRIDASAPAGISQVWLTWNAPSGATEYPLTYLGGASWGLDVPISTTAVSGPRDLTITAYDPTNQAGSSDVQIEVQ